MHERLIEKLGNELTEVSRLKNLKYGFRKEFIGKLLEKWKFNHGRYIIHLSDLPADFILVFTDEGRRKLADLCLCLKRKHGLDRLRRKYKVNPYLLYEYVRCRTRGISVRQFLNILDMAEKLNLVKEDYATDIENFVKEIKPWMRSKQLKLDGGLPIDLTDPKWAFIFGVILDSGLGRFKFTSKHKSEVMGVFSNLRDIGVTPSLQREGNAFSVKGDRIVSKLLEIGGINISEKQVIANNPLPPWIFSKTSQKYQSIILAKIFETEGSFSDGTQVKIAQGTNMDLSSVEKQILSESSYIVKVKPSGVKLKYNRVNKVTNSIQQKIISNPPLILVSTQLLLRKLKVNSYAYPEWVYLKKGGDVTVIWYLVISGFDNIKRFYDLCSDFIGRKDIYIRKFLENRKNDHIHAGLSASYFLLNMLEIEKGNGFFTTKDVIKSTNRKLKTVVTTTGYLHNKKLIKCVGKNGHIKKWKITTYGKQHLENTGIESKEKWIELFG